MEISMKCNKFKKAFETAEQYHALQSIVSCIILVYFVFKLVILFACFRNNIPECGFKNLVKILSPSLPLHI